MIVAYLLLLLISYSQECAPTRSVATTTVAPNTTTTQPVNATTTAVETTTGPNACCSWPFLSTAINTASVSQGNWNGCDESVSFFCTYTNGTTQANTPTSLAIVVNHNSTGPFGDAVRVLATMDARLNVTVTCNTTAHLWSISTGTDTSTSGALYSLFACAYYLNGTWSQGLVEG
ncbi:unnamed protein product [Caenorhabditis nigoni]